MNYAKRMRAAPVLYSCCSGHNFYFSDDRRAHQVFHKSRSIIQHVKTLDYFYASPFPQELNTDVQLDFWVELIRKPTDLKHFIWPVDVVMLPPQTEHPGARYALVFPIRALPVFESISSLLANDMQLGWDKPWVQKFTANLLDAWCHFDASRYAYHEFSADNMFYQKENLGVMFDFSFSTHRPQGLFDTRPVAAERVTPDFADSYYYLDERQPLMDLASDYYSIAVILFKLMVGRLPYQGRVMEHEPDSNESEHHAWLKVYHKNAYFIFDTQDTTNRIGGETGFAKDELFVDRWNSLPVHVRNMFHNVFQTPNVLRQTDELIFYSPGQWREALFGSAGEVPLEYRRPRAETHRPEPKAAPRAEPATGAKPALGSRAGAVPRVDPDAGRPVPQGPPEAPRDGPCYDVIMTVPAATGKIVALKLIREITGLGLGPAKDLYERIPSVLVRGVSRPLAQQIEAELRLVHVQAESRKSERADHKQESEIRRRMQGRWMSTV